MRTFWITLGLALAASLAGKWLADAFLDSRVALMGDLAGLVYSQNPGIAFGIRLPESIQTWVISAAAGLVILLALTTAKTPLTRVAFGLIVAGALGNVLDRLPDGRVTDFFQVGTFPIFNVADSCITVGAALLILDVILEKFRGIRNPRKTS